MRKKYIHLDTHIKIDENREIKAEFGANGIMKVYYADDIAKNPIFDLVPRNLFCFSSSSPRKDNFVFVHESLFCLFVYVVGFSQPDLKEFYGDLNKVFEIGENNKVRALSGDRMKVMVFIFVNKHSNILNFNIILNDIIAVCAVFFCYIINFVDVGNKFRRVSIPQQRAGKKPAS